MSPSLAAAPLTPGHAAHELYGALWRHAEGARGQLAGALALLGSAQLLRLAMPWLAAQAINALQRTQLETSTLWIAALMAVYLVSWLLHGPGRVLERNVAVHVREQLGDRLYARIAGAPLAWHGAQHSGELQHRVHQASRALADFAQNPFVYLQNIVNFFGPLVALTLLSGTSGALALAGYVLIAAVILRFDRALMLLARQENGADRRYVAALVDFIGNIGTVIGLRLAAASRALMRLRVLAGLYPPAAGTLRLDGAPQDWARLRRLATLIPQETEVFEASVRENLAFGTPHADAELLAAVHASAFDEVLAALHGDLDTPLTERGANLSGGQRQRLCLARGVLAAHGSALLLLDEPTSALDPATEARVLQRIAARFPDACLVASVHRLGLLAHFDTVVLMEAGRVRDAGPRDDVLARQPQLRRDAPHPSPSSQELP